MNTVKKLTLIDRIRNAVKAFKGTQVGSLTFGVDVKRCDECEYKCQVTIRDNLLVSAGARAAYMDWYGEIDFPGTIDGEDELALAVTKWVDYYLNQDEELNFDEFIENRLLAEYGTERDI